MGKTNEKILISTINIRYRLTFILTKISMNPLKYLLLTLFAIVFHCISLATPYRVARDSFGIIGSGTKKMSSPMICTVKTH